MMVVSWERPMASGIPDTIFFIRIKPLGGIAGIAGLDHAAHVGRHKPRFAISPAAPISALTAQEPPQGYNPFTLAGLRTGLCDCAF
jgi:hypothetical protein